jgi:hypothetical protein
MVAYRKSFLGFWYHFIVGDDWTIAAGVVIALVLSTAPGHRDSNGWWVMPVAVIVILPVSLWREISRSR